jgi:8-amino-7-oxononanoate synthase
MPAGSLERHATFDATYLDAAIVQAMPQENDVIDFAGNDYLGLSREPQLADAAHRAAVQFGISVTSSRWGLGWTEIHEQLELELGDHKAVP